MPTFDRKILRNNLTAAAILILLAGTFSVLAERLPVRVYSTADGLGSGAVDDMIHDSRGFMWFATRDGLSRFDGFSVVNYRIGDQPLGSILGILERKDGSYLVTPRIGGVYRFDETTTVVESAESDMLTLNAVRILNDSPARIAEDSEGTLWVVIDGKFRRVREDAGKFTVESPLAIDGPIDGDVTVFHFNEDRERTFWLTTNHGLLRVAKDGRLLAMYTTPPPTAMRTYLLYVFSDRDGRVWVQAQDGMFVLKPDAIIPGAAPIVHPLNPNISTKLPVNRGEIRKFTESDGLRGTAMPAFHQTPDGRIWIASDAGLLLFEGNGFRLFGPENGIAEFVLDIVNDGEGNLWLATLSGVHKIVANGLVTFRLAEGLTKADISGIYENKAGRLFVAGGDWNIGRYDGARGFTSVRPKFGKDAGASLWTSNVSFLDSSGSWWFLSETALYRYENVERVEDLESRTPDRVFPTGDLFNNGAFYRMFEDSRGDIWTSLRSVDFANMGLDVWRRADERFQKFGEAENFPERRSPSAFCEDSQGDVWVGFYHGGLARFKDGKFTLFGSSDGVPQGFVTSLFRDHRNRIWIATSDNGVSVIDDPKADIPSFRKIGGLASNNARAIAEDAFGLVYIGTVRGIDRITPETGVVLHLSTVDGLADDFVTVAFRDSRGSVWFGTRDGVSRLDPREDPPQSAPPILIARVRVAGVKQSVPELGTPEVGNLDLQNYQNNLQIDYSSVGFASPERVRYQFMLEGADTDWSAPTAERSVIYSNLAAGDYRFLVRALNSQGLASLNPASVKFHVAPPIWKTWWFVTAAFLAFVAIAYYLLNQRFKRSLELEKVRTRIATDLHDDIGASLSRISILSEIEKQQTSAENAESTRRLSQIASEAQNLVDSMSDIVWAINPRRDSIESVVDRVCSFAADTLGAKDVHWTVSTPSDLGHVHLTTEEKRNLYLIFKEAVNNAARHSNCANASLTIRFDRNVLIAEIADDGCGFTVEEFANDASRGGSGHENMKTRAAEVGGTLEIESAPERGTVVRLRLPISLSRSIGRLTSHNSR